LPEIIRYAGGLSFPFETSAFLCLNNFTARFARDAESTEDFFYLPLRDRQLKTLKSCAPNQLRFRLIQDNYQMNIQKIRPEGPGFYLFVLSVS